MWKLNMFLNNEWVKEEIRVNQEISQKIEKITLQKSIGFSKSSSKRGTLW